MIDRQRRKRVMQRSMQLGHCVCNPQKACPCDTLIEKDVCPCAGERPADSDEPVRLTQHVESAGCASKIDAQSLRRILAGLPEYDDPRVLVGMPAGDDAGVYQLDEATALVQTVDVFSPSIDDPYQFGQVAAANSLSDVYAMGGRPLTALSIIGFPLSTLPDRVMRDILRGGIDKMAEAGVPVVGGHSIKDNEVKAGFAVTGVVDPRRIMTNAGVQPGDALVLTKPLGTGILAFAAQIGRDPPGTLAAAAQSMTTLNRRAAELMLEHGAHACTDVTGFGLLGHLGAMAAASGVDVEIIWDDLPLLPGVVECAAAGIASGAVERNREATLSVVDNASALPPAVLDICCDAQTSGGLLIALPRSAAAGLVERLRAEGVSATAIVGGVPGAGEGRITIRCDGRRPIPAPPEIADVRRSHEEQNVVNDRAAQPCCGAVEERPMADTNECCGNPAEAATTGGADEVQQAFQEFMKAASAPGKLDARTKKAIAIALSVLAKCEPCAKIHMRKAKDMGMTQEEIDEAAWLAISFGGCPTMMFYNSVKRG